MKNENENNNKYVDDDEKISDVLYAVSMKTAGLLSMLLNGKISLDEYIKEVQRISDVNNGGMK